MVRAPACRRRAGRSGRQHVQGSRSTQLSGGDPPSPHGTLSLSDLPQARAPWRGVVTFFLLGAGLVAALVSAYLGGLRAGSVTLPAEVTLAASSIGADAELRPSPVVETVASPDGARSASRDLHCLTQAIYFEARGESPAGQAAVAQVVLNRVRKAGFPKSVCGVVFQGSARGTGCQFSFTCDGSMNRTRERQAWSQARRIATRALAGAVMTAVGDATHFHTVHVSPDWSRDLREVAQVGLHIFYRKDRASGEVTLAEASDAPVGTDLRVSEAQLVSGPPSDPVEVVEAPPPPAPALAQGTEAGSGAPAA
ncbi:MAG: cell wall hydrolase [Phenylobacterium sp.]|nr:cell wall hydrolase [Phenylobacterium sp.]